MSDARSGPRLARWRRAAIATLRRIIGAPDYGAYLRHMRVHHPHAAVLTEEAFIRERMERRYSTPGSRCC